MRFTILGSSAGTPSRHRNVSGLALGPEQGRGWALVDCGEATQHQLMGSGFSPGQLQAIFVTHAHGDHCYGLPGLLASLALSGRRQPLTLCAPQAVLKFVQAAIEHTDMHLSYELIAQRVAEAGPVLQLEFATVHAIRLSHCIESYGYQFRELPRRQALDPEKLAQLSVPRGPLWGELARGRAVTLADDTRVESAQVIRKRRRPRVIVVGGDNDRPELLAEALADSDVLVHEATFTEPVLARLTKDLTHSSALQVARVAADSGLKNLVLSHFSPRYTLHNRDPGLTIAALEQEAREQYCGRLFMARDLLSYRLDGDGLLHQQQPE